MKTLIFTIATGKYYNLFIPKLFNSLTNYIKFDFEFICFTDNVLSDKIKKIKIQHRKWPFNTLLRYHDILDNISIFTDYDYVLYFDADMLVVDNINSNDILYESVVVLHPGFTNKPVEQFTYESNPQSTAFIPKGQGINYYQGCLQGGSVSNFLNMCESLKKNINQDLKNNIIAIFHDESHLNKYRFINPPKKILSPEYAAPAEWLGKPYEKILITQPKILHLPKNNYEVGKE